MARRKPLKRPMGVFQLQRRMNGAQINVPPNIPQRWNVRSEPHVCPLAAVAAGEALFPASPTQKSVIGPSLVRLFVDPF